MCFELPGVPLVSSKLVICTPACQPGCWRANSELLKQTCQPDQLVLVQDALKAARGWQFCGIDRSVWIFILTHAGLVALLLSSDSDLSRRVAGKSIMPDQSGSYHKLTSLQFKYVIQDRLTEDR